MKYSAFSYSLITAICLFAATHAFAADFTDIKDNPYHDAIVALQQNKIIQGYSDGTFKPDALVNRAEFTKILIGAIEDPFTINVCMEDTKYTDLVFPDVPYNSWYEDSVCVAKGEGIVNGYPNGTFGPNKNINYAEAAKILVKAFKLQVSKLPQYPESDGNYPWYTVYSTTLTDAGVVPQTIDSYDHSLTRGEMAEFLYRLKYKKDSVADGKTVTYTDLVDHYSFSYPSSIFIQQSKMISSGYFSLDIPKQTFHTANLFHRSQRQFCPEGPTDPNCTPLAPNLIVNFFVIHHPFSQVKPKPDDRVTQKIIGGRTVIDEDLTLNIPLHNYYISFDAKSTLVVEVESIDEKEWDSENITKDFLKVTDQQKILDQLFSTLKLPSDTK